ncbi:MAG: DNA repair protein RadC [Bacteroidota bacterium]
MDGLYMEESANITIKSWAEADRPREKLLLKGRHTLTDAELLAILIRTGTKKETAIDLAKKILNDAKNNLNELSKFTVHDIMKYKGMGEAKAITIIAALEIGRRRKESKIIKREKIFSSKDTFEIFFSVFQDIPHEEFWMLLLNRANQVIKKEFISRGGVSSAVVDAKIIFKTAIQHLACGIILCHNHPSGNLKPSDRDIQLTKNLKEAGKILDVSVLDHIIISDNGYFSFADEGMM